MWGSLRGDRGMIPWAHLSSRTILACLPNVIRTKAYADYRVGIPLLENGHYSAFPMQFPSQERFGLDHVNWFQPTNHSSGMPIPVVSCIAQPQVPTRLSWNILMMIHQSSLALRRRTRTIAPALSRLLALLPN